MYVYITIILSFLVDPRYIILYIELTLGCKSNMLVVAWLGGLTWLILVSAVASVPAADIDDVAASFASAAAAAPFVSLVIVGSASLPM